MKHVKYLILGAGPAGLTFARCLEDNGIKDYLLIEKETQAGGLCRSTTVDESPFDLGGGHFLDVRRPKVVDFLFRFLPKEEWDSYNRDSKINIGDVSIDHPFEANIWQMPKDMQDEYLASIETAGCNKAEPIPERFVSWIHWKLGDKIAADYMLPYNRKMFANDLDELGTYWLEKLPNVSYEETLQACQEKKPYGSQPGHAKFYYPKKYGFGEVWLRIAKTLGNHILYETCAKEIDFDKREVVLGDGEILKADCIVNTIPWIAFETIRGIDADLLADIGKLKHSAIETRYVPERLDTTAQWIYIPDETISYHRILVRHNFCPNSKGYWVETRKERIEEGKDDFFHYLNEYAYPLNTIEKPKIMNKLLNYAKKHGIYGLGRWGEHCHYNADLVVELAMHKADELITLME